MTDWSKATMNTPKFSLDGRTFEAKVVSVYDGDTVNLVFELFGELHRWSCRLNHIDTPELRTSNESEKSLGLKVRDVLRDKILNEMVTIQCSEFDKYGRLLVSIVHDGLDVNEWLIEQNYAKRYDGGKKESWFTE